MPSRPKSKQRTILMVEDDDVLLECFCEILSESFQVLTSNSIEQAQELINNSSVDAVFCDLHIGRRSGLELLSWIQLHKPSLLQRTAIISGNCCSSLADFDVPIILKPIEAGELLRLATVASNLDTGSASA